MDLGEHLQKLDRQLRQPPVVQASDLQNFRHQFWTGSKYPGGFGPLKLLTLDYWTLRQKSTQLFRTNMYARGLIRRLLTNEINTGLEAEVKPEELVLGVPIGTHDEWTEAVETRLGIWGSLPQVCDQQERLTFGGLQRAARGEALISGDVLVVLRMDRRRNLPRVQLISGGRVRSPIGKSIRKGNQVRHGVELDAQGRHVAYWIQTDLLKFERLPAFGERSGRRIAWLLYGVDKRLDDVRGEPMLSIILQSLNEVDRYRDSTQRKALLGSFLALYLTKEQQAPGSRSITGGAVRKGTDTIDKLGDQESTGRLFNTAEFIPGLIFDELQPGEEPKAFPNAGTDEKFGEFEAAMIQAIAWANEVPPEILQLAFSNNYSASQAAINEFRMYLNKIRQEFAEGFCVPIYQEWLLSEVLANRIEAQGLIEAWRDPQKYDLFGAWMASEWTGHIKPSTDVFKQARGYKMMVDEAWITNQKTSRELTGTKFSRNIRQLRLENKQKAEVLKPLSEAGDPVTLSVLDEIDRQEQQQGDG